MATLEKLRNEIDDKYKWDLTTIYKNDEAWEEDYKKAEEKLKEITKYRDSFLSSSKNFISFLEFDEKLERLILKLYYYAHLKYDSDTLNDHYKTMFNKIRDLYSKYEELSSFVSPSILKQDYSLFEKFFNEEEKLKDYKFLIDEIYRYKKYTLDEKEEEMLSTLSNIFSSPEDTFEALSDSDLKFGTIKDEDGKEIEFNESNYSIFIRSKDRRVRHDAFNMLFSKYSEFKNTIASTFKGNVEVNVINAKLRKFNSALDASLFSDNVDSKIYNNLIEVVNDNLDVMYKYYDLKKKVLGLDEFHLYDVYADLIKECDKNYSFEEAKDLVIKSLSVLGDDYVKKLNRAFDEKWIDIYHNKGKRSGAYSSGFYDTNPFLLLNYEGKLDDVSTLAHELGHSLHTLYSNENNSYKYSSYKIFVAEVASTVNELLLSKYLLKNSNSKEEKLSILNHLLELFKGTIYRQTMFAEFERDMHKARENKEILTNSYLSDNYYKLVKKYFGPGVICDDLIKYEWERIPHFYYNFYVYKYATSLSCACFIVDGILNNKDKALENYIDFLKLGGSMYPVDELKKTGIDITQKDVIESAIKMFDSTIDEFTEVYNS